MFRLKEELLSREERRGVFRIGHLYASAFAGFLAGFVVGGLFMLLLFIVADKALQLQ